MTARAELLRRITARPDVFGGKPIVRDMRISVELILGLLAQGVTPEAMLDDYPGLEPDDIRASASTSSAASSEMNRRRQASSSDISRKSPRRLRLRTNRRQ